MKQIKLVSATLALALAFSAPAMAEKECVGGTLVTANKYGTVNGVNQDRFGNCKSDGSNCNGKTFCVSDGNMKWWSAFLWCESNGRTVAKWEDMCPDTPIGADYHPGACANLAGIGLDFYTPISYDSGRVYTIRSDAQIITPGKNDIYPRAICE